MLMITSLLGRIILRVSYGIDVQEADDPYIAAAEHGLWIANQCMAPGAWLVDLIPICTYPVFDNPLP